MILEFIDKVVSNFTASKTHVGLRRFIAHNRAVFSSVTGAKRGTPVVLLELNEMQSAHIAYSYLATVLATQHSAKIVAYAQRAHLNLLQKGLFRIRAMAGRNVFGVYKSFGVSAFLGITPSRAQKAEATKMFADVFGRLNSKSDIEELKIDDVWIGDLIYDSFLMAYKRPTIDKESPEFKRSLLESLEFYVFWRDYLDNHDVRAINVSHCVYNLAIPLRLAVQRGIPVFQANATHVYRLSAENLFAYNDFFHFPDRFLTLPPEVKEAGLAEAQRRIERRFAGEVGVDMAYSKKSAYGAKHYRQLLRISPRKKILVATHCFFDAPHCYGNSIFPDFLEWLEFLGKMTIQTEYDWYIKTHPDYLAGTKEIIDSFVAKYPRFTLLPPDASHHQIIAEGVDVALTVYGTIGFEYAALGITVINASQNNPHIAYRFNLHATDVEDYRRLLTDLDRLTFSIDKRQVLEYYFMRHIFNTEDLFFNSYDSTVAELGGYSEQFTPAIYEKWLAEWSPEKHLTIISALQSFIQSNDFRMDYRHYGRDFTVESMGTMA